MDILSFASTENQSLVALVNGSSVCDVAIVASQFAAIFIRRRLDLEGATDLADGTCRNLLTYTFVSSTERR